ncbi:hypothetical protein ABZX95_13710 [Streptomyces sp. NPDC004232]|uniref:hypothetical protein n=1 Tax=Streptomyces sp. NPDC004232 TaxID=3154454 RepID=UPI0033ADCA77
MPDLTRSQVSALLRADASLISPHEHVGSELIQHGAADRHTYRQSVGELMTLMARLRDRLLDGAGTVAALALPMPFYRYFKPEGTAVDPVTAVRAIRRRNHETLDACAEHRATEGLGPGLAVPLAALLADPFRSAEIFAQEYADRREEVFALKWHPAAHLRSPAAHVALGYLELAADWDVPIVVHCAPAGRMGDLPALRTQLLARAAEAGVRIGVAHAGHLDPALPQVLTAPGVYADLGPWEALRERTLGAPAPTGHDERLGTLLASSGSRLMFSLDSPWHLEHWASGRLLGAPAEESLARLLAAAAAVGAPRERLLHENAYAFLFGDRHHHRADEAAAATRPVPC